MLNSTPNLDYLKAAWSALACISGRNAEQSYEASGLTLQRINHSTIVHKGQVQVATMPLRYTRSELRVGFLGRIENEVRKAVSELDSVLFHSLDMPEGHRLVIELEESMRSLRRTGGRMLSIFVQPDPDTEHEVFYAVEMRVFLDAPRACLFAYRVTRQGEEKIDLLAQAPKRTRVPRAASYAALAQQMAETINAALYPEADAAV
jgi:hypothetical protein